jgi:carbonic anhydrase/acetyltransferase-like protein (isoleucine patch superfamily)
MTAEDACARFVAPYILPYEGTEPRFATAPRLYGSSVSVLGKVQIGARSTLACSSVIRADGHFVRIGDDFYLGEFSTVHIAHETYPTIIGDGVTVGRNAVVHACTVGSHCVIEDDVVILDGSVVGGGVLIEAGATVFPRSSLMAGRIYSGSPAMPIRDLTPSERSNRESRIQTSSTTLPRSNRSNASSMEYRPIDDGFVAQTACLSGSIRLERRSTVFFGCHLDAGDASIAIDVDSNIQDNTRIQCDIDGVTIGRATTIGHNAQLKSCRIGQQSLVGIGSVVSRGTIIDDDVLLAAGSKTNEGQYLERGWMWGGRPARPISKLDDAKRLMMAQIIDQYYAYGRAYERAQRVARRGG